MGRKWHVRLHHGARRENLMASHYSVLLLEDEPLILMDLEFAAEDRGLHPFTATTCEAALALVEQNGNDIDLAILDVSLGGGSTCFPVARQLDRHGIPYVLHTGDLDRHNERVRLLQAPLIAKPAPAEAVVGAAVENLLSVTPND